MNDHVADSPANWTIDDALRTYGIARWGSGYFGVNPAGHMTVRPLGTEGAEVDLLKVALRARERGLHYPLLIRFHDLLRHRVRAINEAFAEAIRTARYKGEYRGVFPVKVNQMREVVEEILEAGEPYHFGLEVGSKPELFAALAHHRDPDSLLVCNGYKDAEFIRTALLGRKLGKKVILVIEKPEELRLAVATARSMQVELLVGVRVRLSARGVGKWALSGGDSAKFGLSTSELLEAVEYLRKEGCPEALQMLHFHVGSQVPDILALRRAVREATRYYAQLHHLGLKPAYLDVGGGLAIDYDGSRSDSESSMNYTLTEYARDVVRAVAEVCRQEKVPHPTLVSESGRATVAHHSVLLVEVFGTIDKTPRAFVPAKEEDPEFVRQLSDLVVNLNRKNRRESLHDGLTVKEEAAARFDLGLLDLPTKARVEDTFWHLAERITALYSNGRPPPEEIRSLMDQLGKQYLCNFSVFQSLIDHWALKQLFPIVPIQRLNEAPIHQGRLVDITCDSDGKIDHFVDATGTRSSLPLHDLAGQPYLLGFFLLGAYQDVMGDLHNLFGSVNEAHVYLDADEPDGFYIEETIPGFSIGRVLGNVQYEPSQLSRLIKAQVDEAIKQDKIKATEGMDLFES
ncbi:MAG: biosynthetic arginine decarboxylase, partial [Verrucomicrobia bacterium]|nr:biosynthetic arginine decarboxylase [Verrucomicrobiota bacterium]